MSTVHTSTPDPSPGDIPGGRWYPVIQKISDILSKGAAGLSALMCLGLAAIVGYSVFMRYIVNQPQTWTDELAGYMMVFIVMLGLAETTRRSEHIGVDLVMEILGNRGRRLIEIWGLVCMIVVSSAVLYSSYGMVEFSYSVDLISEGYVEAPMWIPQSSVPLGMTLLLIAAVTRLIGLWVGALTLDKRS